MRVVHLNTTASLGGAAQAVRRLHVALAQQGVDSAMRVQFGASGAAAGISGPADKAGKAAALVRDVAALLPLQFYRRSPGDVYSADLVLARTERDVRRLRPDLIHLHWINAGFVPIHLLRRFRRPLVWTLHDMWPMTGGCHHARACTGYQAACGHCPVLNSAHAWDLSRAILAWKSRSWRDLAIHLIAPSRWMAEQARRSSQFRDAAITVIPNGVDLARYRPWDRGLARNILQLPDTPLILFSASKGLVTPYKGGDVALAAVAGLRASGCDATLVVMGGGPEDRIDHHQVPVRYLGYLHDDVSRALACAAADICLSCSSEDNLPSTITESLACGTPVVAYDVGGIGDTIEDGQSGYLVEFGDLTGLVQAMKRAIEHRPALAVAARARAESTFDIESVATAHRRLYEALLET